MSDFSQEIQSVRDAFGDVTKLSAEERKSLEQAAKLSASLSAKLLADTDYEWQPNAAFIESIFKDHTAIFEQRTKQAIFTVLTNLVGILKAAAL